MAAKSDPKRGIATREIGDYYAACMDEAAIDKRGAEPLQQDLNAISDLKEAAALAPLLAKLHLETSGSGLLFGFGSDQDFANSTHVIAEIGQGGLGLPDRDYYTKDDAKSQELRQKYVQHVAKMLELIGETAEKAAENARTILRIETELAKASQTRVARRDPHNVYHKMSPEQVSALAPSFGFAAYLENAGVPTVKEINVETPDHLKAAETLLKSEPIENWKAYLRWHLVHAKAAFLAAPFVQENFNFYSKTLRGVNELQPRWKRCVNYVDDQLGEALGQAYVAITFPPQSKVRTLKMVREIEVEMGNRIRALDWMSDATKQQALAKLKLVANKIGYPDKWRDYSSIKLTRDDFMSNVDQATIFESRRQLNKIGKPVDRGEWGMTPPTVNAYYNPQMNDINFPAGVLQPPLFDARSDDAPNYGDTGATIGHELTHGFDDEGRQFDGLGNLREWWTEQDAKEFSTRAACVSDQYSSYIIVDDIHINGKLTLGEDVADLGGTILAYVAWKDATQGQKLAPKDGFTPEQRFFIGYAQSWCSNERPENMRLRAVTDPHSPAKDRANGVVANMPEFWKAFSCKQGQPMVNKTVCKIW